MRKRFPYRKAPPSRRLTDQCAQIIRISEPIKRSWAEKLGLDLRELLSDGPYKERYRREMIEWSDRKRLEDAGFFCRQACAAVNKEIVIVSDVRRKTDLQYFRETYGERAKTVRIVASEKTRSVRGWVFQEGVDDVQSECDLDDVTEWDLAVCNESDANVDDLLDKIEKLL
ncbi:phosphomevalonate kinase isoform X2 [Sabethes cyaneus]|uniref:phosphomevalonate kinase isoform X2 n=1 Tax=Sabethes cyaneus TaxID=53552 RepID=UPI00237E61DE|nr:phosphomevalonate kinase isoform X2 [Sabethes cyaneus]